MTLILSSCMSCYQTCSVSSATETWLCQLNLDANRWTRCADSWFLTGRANLLEHKILSSEPDRPATFMTVRVGNFNKIVVNGSFQVQIVGGQKQNSLYVLGSNPVARQVSVRVCNGTLYLLQPTTPATVFDKTIVRIGVRDLRSLTNYGCGNIYGRYICSSQLNIASYGLGNIMLSGNMNINCIKQFGTGQVVIIGANTPYLDINVIGNGIVNVCGHVGVHSINHRGNGMVHVLGADSRHLTIFTSGCGVTTVVGFVNLKKVISMNSSRVYLYWVKSRETEVIATDHARVSLAGITQSLHVNLKNYAELKGQYLKSGHVFVRTENFSHANVTTHQQLFADANNRSSIYYFGHPHQFSRFTTGMGIIIPVPETPCPCALAPDWRKCRF